MTTDSLPSAADAERLTEALRRSGVLDHGHVCNVVVMSSVAKLRSHTFRLRLDYDGPGRSSYVNRREIKFYQDVASKVWSIDTATNDLAYMMAILWYPDRRRRLERPLLDPTMQHCWRTA